MGGCTPAPTPPPPRKLASKHIVRLIETRQESVLFADVAGAGFGSPPESSRFDNRRNLESEVFPCRYADETVFPGKISGSRDFPSKT